MMQNLCKNEFPAWKSLYRTGGIVAFLIVAMYIVTSAVVLPAYGTDPIPGDTAGWFGLLGEKPAIGLFYLGLADIVNSVLSVPLVLALCAALWKGSRMGPALSAAFMLLGAATYLTANIAFSMLDLSHQYANTAILSQKLSLLSAGQAMIALNRGTGILVSSAFASSSTLILSVCMLRNGNFGKITPVLGIVAFSLLLAGTPFGGTYTAVEQKGMVETAVVYLTSIAGGFFSMIWYIPVGIRLARLGFGGNEGGEMLRA